MYRWPVGLKGLRKYDKKNCVFLALGLYFTHYIDEITPIHALAAAF